MKIPLFLTTSVVTLFAVAAEPADPNGWKPPQPLAALELAPASVIPFPREAAWGQGRVEIPPSSRTFVKYQDNDKLDNAQQALLGVLGKIGCQPTVNPAAIDSQGAASLTFIFKIDQETVAKPEGYRLQIVDQGLVLISAHDPAGAFYAVQTLRQLLVQEAGKAYLPTCTIRDWPAFGLRGFMHDTGRNFQEVADLKKQIDLLASYKYNAFHWHLTDNPAWRPQSKLFPQLNDPKNRQAGRDPEKSYSFDEIRDVMAYAKARQVNIIPELDMPGHSAYFKPTFGCAMDSDQGMQILEKLIDEFCAEIPAADCPIIHLGSDEVHIKDPQGFMKRMSNRVRANGRQVMVWNPGLKGEPGTLEQLWRDQGSDSIQANRANPVVDSSGGYLNSSDALLLVQRYFFQQPCRKPEGDAMALGGILCCWPDIRVDDKSKIFLHSPVWPGALAFAESVWCGRPGFRPDVLGVLPDPDSEAGKCFRNFEQRLAAHRDRYFTGIPFPYVRFGQIPWRIAGPFVRNKAQPETQAFAPETGEDKDLAWRPAFGGLLAFKDRNLSGLALKGDVNSTMYAQTYLHSDQARTIRAWIGFETPGRANRQSGGVPPAGKWDANGGTVFINGTELPAPAWKLAGQRRYLNPTWFTPANEIPLDDEEFYWAREPAEVPLKPGWNKILLRVPRTYGAQNWNAAFIPVRRDPATNRWIEDLEVKFSTAP